MEDGIRVRGGPDWIRNERYTIEAVAEGAADAATIQGPMLRALLERRFQLKTHIETEQIPAFALTVNKGGLKIKSVQAGACEPQPQRTPGVRGVRPLRSFEKVRPGEKPFCGIGVESNGPNVVIVGGEATLGDLAMLLGRSLDRMQVRDETGNSEKFNFVLEFAIEENTPSASIFFPRVAEPSDIPPGQTIYSALQDQLGLRLEKARAPRAFIVIDHVERLLPN